MFRGKGQETQIIQDDAKPEIMKIFASLDKPVRIKFFKSKTCTTCIKQQRLLEELTALSSKLSLEVYDVILHGDEALNYKVTKVPVTVILSEADYGIRFYGLTAGHEFSSLLSTITMVSAGVSLSGELQELIKGIDKPVSINVMTTLTCPYCPQMVQAANLFAFLNPLIESSMYNVSEFPEVAARYNVQGVPRTVINDIYMVDGAVSLPDFLLAVLRVVKPDEYSDLEDKLRESMGLRRITPVEPDHLYDVIIVGGGPAGFSAAVYGYRKGMDVAILSERIGGQLSYTARIDNYLGLQGVSGQELIGLFRRHLEQYPVAQTTGSKVNRISKDGNVFRVTSADGVNYSGRSVILCTGMEYKRLGVPGEEELLGKGVAFCATCDAPLYQGKRVAVIGGGNSAFTAIRDLIGYASEIHLFHRRDEYSADEVLVNEILSTGVVKQHLSSKVIGFKGESKLTGLSYETEDAEVHSLDLDGAFIEIGLTPNSDPVRGLVDLNEQGEVQVELDGSTSVPGLYAAGDVTEVAEKQISIAVGQGTSAVLSAYRYLSHNFREKQEPPTKN